MVCQPKLSAITTRRSQHHGVSATGRAWGHGLPQREFIFHRADLTHTQASPGDPPQLVVSWNPLLMAPTNQHQLISTNSSPHVHRFFPMAITVSIFSDIYSSPLPTVIMCFISWRWFLEPHSWLSLIEKPELNVPPHASSQPASAGSIPLALTTNKLETRLRNTCILFAAHGPSNCGNRCHGNTKSDRCFRVL